MRYMAPVHDPWFSANGTYNFTYGNHRYNIADKFVSPLVCADQYWLCNPSSHICTPPGGIFQLATHLTQHTALRHNTVQTDTAARLMVSLAEINMFSAVFAPGGADALRAQRLSVGNVSPGLPDDQWRAEVEGWFQMNLARLQADVVDFAVKRGGPLLKARRERKLGMQPLSPAQLEQCGNQLVRAVGEVQNFSLVGVVVVVCVCAALVLVDLSLERAVDLVGAWFGRRPASSASDARQADGKLHLLCMALVGASGKEKDWKLGRWSVPVTGRGEGVERLGTCTVYSVHTLTRTGSPRTCSLPTAQKTVEEREMGRGARRGPASPRRLVVRVGDFRSTSAKASLSLGASGHHLDLVLLCR
jgi:hypothetical protein